MKDRRYQSCQTTEENQCFLYCFNVLFWFFKKCLSFWLCWVFVAAGVGFSQVAVSRCVRCSVVSNSLQLHGLWSARLLCPWNSPGKNIGVGSHYLLQGTFQIQAFELRSPAFQSDSLPPWKQWAGATLCLHCEGFALLWFLLLLNTGSRAHWFQ